jgi:S-adenosyl-L-methionine hydrolase (adenosine-forming)
MKIITLTSDFGETDHYIACMKGVILQYAPDARLIDVTHAVQPHDVVHGAFVLRQVFDYFPVGTIHIAVVDPGVGTSRRLIAAKYEGRIFLTPDNGLVSLIHRDFEIEELRSIENRHLFGQPVSATFHGRDILAPVAGHLARGVRFETVGPIIAELEILNLDRPTALPNGGMEGQVLYVDRFGNLISNIGEVDLAAAVGPARNLNVYVGPLRVGPLRLTYADVNPGEIVALIGSTGMLEIAINRGNAAAQLRAVPGTIVVVR